MAIELRALEAEPWGSRLRRARDATGLNLDGATARINEVWPASRRSVARLEELVVVPDGQRALLAYVALLAYGFDPKDFDLGSKSAPTKALDRDRILTTLGPAPQAAPSTLRSR